MMEDDPLHHPMPSGIIEPISIFRARVENIDEPCVKAIIHQAEVDELKVMPHNNDYGVLSVVEIPLHVGCQDPVLGTILDVQRSQDNVCHWEILNNFSHLLKK